MIQESARLLLSQRQEEFAGHITCLWYRGKKEAELAQVFRSRVKVKVVCSRDVSFALALEMVGQLNQSLLTDR